jgi:DNA invertase Pin-like site-specific DNA recombinase
LAKTKLYTIAIRVYIYALTLTKARNVQQQIEFLQSCYSEDEVYADQSTGKSLDHPVFNQLVKNVKSGDTIVAQDLS